MNSTMIEIFLNGKQGETVKVKPDYILVNDGPAHKAIDYISDKDSVVNNIIIVIDYDVPASTTKSSEIFKKLVNFSKMKEIDFIQAKGIRYQILIDDYLEQKDIIVSCDKHNSIFGSIGALGLTVDVQTLGEEIFKKGEYSFQIPKTTLIELKGQPTEDFEPLNLVFEFIKRTNELNLEGQSIEFAGNALDYLNEHQKKVLCSRAADTGAVTAFINENYNKNEARYSQKIKLNINELESLVLLPAPKDQFKIENSKKIEKIKFDAGFIGGFTGGYIEDLRKVVNIISGQELAKGFRLSVSPVTAKVYLQAIEEGIIKEFIDFGAQIIVPGDRNIINQGPGVIGAGEKLITTGVYNFPGSQGSVDGEVYIASVNSVAKASISKTLV